MNYQSHKVQGGIGNMVLHCGGGTATWDDVKSVETPKVTKTFFPIPHTRFIEMVRDFLAEARVSVTEERYALNKNGNQFFGLMGLNQQGMSGAYQWAIGLRNAHDQSYRAAVVAGTRVFVCDNLAFSGEIEVLRKHTRYAERDLGHMLSKAVGRLGDVYNTTEARYRQYEATEIDDATAHDIILRAAIAARAITPQRIPDVYRQWHEPLHKDFEPRNLWSLFNAFTDAHKGTSNASTLLNRGYALHGLFDVAAGVEIKAVSGREIDN